MGLVPARRPGWLLEPRCKSGPRGMAAQSPLDCGDGQNPRYRPARNCFTPLSAEEAARREAEDARGTAGFRQSAQWKWAGPGDGSRSRDEMRALDALELESDADFKAVKAAHRRLVKAHHPDANSGDAEAAKRFKQVQAAYDVF